MLAKSLQKMQQSQSQEKCQSQGECQRLQLFFPLLSQILPVNIDKYFFVRGMLLFVFFLTLRHLKLRFLKSPQKYGSARSPRGMKPRNTRTQQDVDNLASFVENFPNISRLYSCASENQPNGNFRK